MTGTIPDVGAAREIERSIRAAYPEIRFFFNHQTQKWVVAQVFSNTGGLILPTGFKGQMTADRPNALYTIENKDGSYRRPSVIDIQKTGEAVRFGREAVSKGTDWLMKQLDDQDKARNEASEKKLRSHVSSIAPEMKRAMRGDSFHGRTR